jgi:hypothetical protein
MGIVGRCAATHLSISARRLLRPYYQEIIALWRSRSDDFSRHNAIGVATANILPGPSQQAEPQVVN